MERIIGPRAAAKLDRRPLLPVDARRSIAVKRDVHEYLVDADPDRFADAFRDVMTDPTGTFGLIRVKRPAEKLGREFRVGERFQGCYSLEGALTKSFSRGWRRPLLPAIEWILATRPVRWLVARLEDALLSDYAIIEELALRVDAARGHDRRTLKYCYLEGTPIAGSSRFSIDPAPGGGCLVTQVFEYQEVNGFALAAFQRFGLKLHDQVVHMQIARAAERAGAPPPTGTIPICYAAN
jgi:hypothetical protein